MATLKKDLKLVFQDRLWLNVDQKYCRMEHSAILSMFIKLPFVIKIVVLSIFERPFYTGFTVYGKNVNLHPKSFHLPVAKQPEALKNTSGRVDFFEPCITFCHNYCQFRNFERGFFCETYGKIREKSLLSFIEIGESCPSHEFLMSQI